MQVIKVEHERNRRHSHYSLAWDHEVWKSQIWHISAPLSQYHERGYKSPIISPKQLKQAHFLDTMQGLLRPTIIFTPTLEAIKHFTRRSHLGGIKEEQKKQATALIQNRALLPVLHAAHNQTSSAPYVPPLQTERQDNDTNWSY